MEARTLELIQHPETISAEDISLLQKELSKYPFMQSLRTLQLSAVHHFDADNYQKELTKTAAYTTDKKILYQFINRKEIEQKNEEAKLQKNDIGKSEEIKETIIEKQTFQSFENQVAENKEPEILPFEIEKEEISDAPFKTRKEDLNYTKETILDQSDHLSDKDEDALAVKPSDISFNGFESFLPDVKFSVPTVKNETSLETIKPKEEPKSEINLEVVQTFEVKEKLASEVVKQEKPSVEDVPMVVKEELKPAAKAELIEIAPESETSFEWKPMNFMSNPLDSQIKKLESETPKQEKNIVEIKPEGSIPKEEADKLVEMVVEKEPKIELEKELALVNEEEKEMTEQQELEDIKEEVASNIPNFVNTWQSWLKIDRVEKPKEETPQVEKIIEKKSEIIDRFIEDNPRISQLKEESQYVVKEKKDDISHLMTETLAKLYVEQKLYSKAIKAYEVLKKKHPEKSDEYKERIKEIKDMRSNK